MTPEQIEYICVNTIYPSARAKEHNVECAFYDDKGVVLAISPITSVNSHNDYNLIYAYDKQLECITMLPVSSIGRIALFSCKEN